MGFRVRKSVKLGPGVRMNFSHKSVGISGGVRGARVSMSSSRRVTGSVGIPGTGVGYSKSAKVGTGRARSSPRTRAAAPPLAPPPKPGLFAPRYEKEFHNGLQAYAKGDTEKARKLFSKSSDTDTGGKVLADDLLAGILAVQAGKGEEAIPHLETVVQSDVSLPTS
jgi:hypothetical protein